MLLILLLIIHALDSRGWNLLRKREITLTHKILLGCVLVLKTVLLVAIALHLAGVMIDFQAAF